MFPGEFLFAERTKWEQEDLIYRMKQVTIYLVDYLTKFEYYPGELNGNDGKPKLRFNKQILEVTVYRDLLKTVPIFS